MSENKSILSEGTLLGNLAKKIKLKVKDGSITTEKLAEGSVTNAKISDASVGVEKFNSSLKKMLKEYGDRIALLEGGIRRIEKPTAKSYGYDGTEKTFVPEGTGYIVSDNNKQTEVGTYTITVTLEGGFIWIDGSEDVLTFTCSIGKVVVPIPESKSVDQDASGGGVVFAVDTDAYTVSGGENSGNWGDYPVVYTLRDKVNSEWSDGTTEDKTVVHHILAVHYVYSGAETRVPSTYYTTNKQKLPQSGEFTVEVSTEMTDGKKCHWIAFRPLSGFTFKRAKDMDNEDISSEIKSKTVEDYIIYYYSEDSNIGNVTKFTIDK